MQYDSLKKVYKSYHPRENEYYDEVTNENPLPDPSFSLYLFTVSASPPVSLTIGTVP